MSIRVAVIGAGSWGTTVAGLVCENAETVLWCRRPELAEEMARSRTNPDYLPGLALHDRLEVTASLADAVGGADVLVMGVPSHGMRATLDDLAGYVRPGVPVVSLAKGLEGGTHRRMTEVIAEVLPGHPTGVLTGPNLAVELAAGKAAAAVVAFGDRDLAFRLQRVFATNTYRVYTNHDVVGSEVAAALKNVVAIASGIVDGLGAGDNTRAAIMTRGLEEVARLGVALGGERPTFAGLAGMGDLLATCVSRRSRNRYVGEQIGRGRTVEDVVAEMQMVAEGVKTSKVVVELAAEHGVDMPISEQVYAVAHHGRTALESYEGLLRRSARPEF